jgi:hypothetical protein
MSKICVGVSKITDKKTSKTRVYKYSDIPTNNGWIDPLIFLPIPFDLMHLKVKDKPKPVSGWWNSCNWEGLRLKKEDIVEQWKRNQEYD